MDETNPYASPANALPPPLPASGPCEASPPGGMAPVEPPPILPRPWGGWATLGWSVLCLVLMVIVQVVVTVPFLIQHLPFKPGMTQEDLQAALMGDSLLLSVITIATVPACLGLLVLLVRVTRYPWRDYFGWHWVSLKTLVLSVVSLVVLVIMWDWMTSLIDRPLIPDFMEQALQSTRYLPLLAVAIVIAAPVWEELFFRGFMFKGFEGSWLGGAGTVFLTSLIFALVHVQYDWFGMLNVFLLGAFLGVVRLWTGSTLLTIVLHAVNNLIALLETMWLLGYFNA